MNSTNDRHEPAGRFLEVIAGVAAFCLSIYLSQGAPWLVEQIGANGDTDRWAFMLVLFLLVVIEATLLLWAWRLILKRPRTDGSLMSPSFLFLFGALFASVITYGLYMGEIPVRRALFAWGLSLGSIALGYSRWKTKQG